MKLEEPVTFDPEDPDKTATLFFTLASCDHDKHLDNMSRLSEMLCNEDLLADLQRPRRRKICSNSTTNIHFKERE